LLVENCAIVRGELDQKPRMHREEPQVTSPKRPAVSELGVIAVDGRHELNVIDVGCGGDQRTF